MFDNEYSCGDPYEPTPEELEEMQDSIDEDCDECDINSPFRDPGYLEFKTEENFRLWLLENGIIW